MNFLHPALFAAGAAAVTIPIVIHLLMRRRRRPIEWAAMRFLLEAYNKHRRRLRLEQWLLLAARCLIVALLGAALARPFFGDRGAMSRGPETVYLLIDNSLTASAETTDITALERHKQLAASLVGTLDPSRGDRVGVIALGGPAESIVMPPSPELGGVTQAIRALDAVESAADLAGAVGAVRDDLDGGNEDDQRASVRVVVLSDFLTGSADLSRAIESLGEGALRTDVFASRPLDDAPTNVSVVSVEPLRPVVISGRAMPGEDDNGISGSTQVRVVLRRFGPGVSDADATKVRLVFERVGGVDPLGEQVVRWAPGQSEATASITADLRNIDRSVGRGVLAARIDRDALEQDNVRRTELSMREALRVAVVAPSRFGARPSIDRFDNGDWVRLALRPIDDDRASLLGGADIDLFDVSPDLVDAPHLAGADAVIVASPQMIDRGSWGRLREFADRGGLVVVIPPADEQAHLWADAMIEEFGLQWTVEPTARELDPSASLALNPSDTSELNLLSLLSAELEQLVEPVSVERVLAIEPGDAEQLLSVNEMPFLIADRAGDDARGLVVVFAGALDLDWTDLPAKPLMVPLLQEIVRQGVGRARGSWSAVAGASPTTPPGAVVLAPIDIDGGSDLRIEANRSASPVRRAGTWRALDDRGTTRGIVVVNADNAASTTETQPSDDVAKWLGAISGREPVWLSDEAPERGLTTAGSGLAQADSAISLLLLAAAGVLALLEVVLARWTSHAAAPPTPVEVPA